MKEATTRTTLNKLTYCTSEGYQCKTKTAMVGHVLEQTQKGNTGHFIFVKGCTGKNHAAHAVALAKPLHEKRISAVLHGGGNVIVDPSFPLREARYVLRLGRLLRHAEELKTKRPMVVEAYMTHSRTPLITEVLTDGRIRKISRGQRLGKNGWKQELKELQATYGDRWTGVRVLAATA